MTININSPPPGFPVVSPPSLPNAGKAPLPGPQGPQGPPGPPGPAGPGGQNGNSIITVANAASSTLADTNVPEGTILYVKTYKRQFTLVTSSSLTTDGTTVLAGSVSGRQWIWDTNWNNNFWAIAWVGHTVQIDPINGLDENDGILTPLQNIREACRRLRNTTLSTGTYTFTFLSPPNATDHSEWPRTLPVGTQIVINGGRTASRSSTLTAATAVANRAASGGGTATVLADTSIANWTADVNSLFRVTSGAHANNCCWVMKDTGGGGITARGSTTLPLATPGGNGTTPATIASGDAYAIEAPWALIIGPHDFVGDSGSGALNGITYNDFDLKSASGIFAFVGFRAAGTSMSATFNRCRILSTGGAIPSNPAGCGLTFNQCLVSGAAPQSSDLVRRNTYNSCAFVSNAGRISSGVHYFTNDTFVQAAPGQVPVSVSGTNANVTLGNVAAFDCTTGGLFGAFVMGRGAVMAQDANAVSLQWGSSNAVYGFSVLSGVFNVVTSTPTVTGSVGDFVINSHTTFRVWNETLGAYTAATANSWANLTAAPYPAAFDVESGAGISAGS